MKAPAHNRQTIVVVCKIEEKFPNVCVVEERTKKKNAKFLRLNTNDS